MGIRILVTLCVSAFLIGAAEAQQYYRWVDENGTVHFSESPPNDNTQAEAARVRASHITRGLSGADSANADSAAATTAPAPQDAENCTKVRANMATLNGSQQVRRVDPTTGETRVMTAAEHQAELERNQRLESIYC